MYYLKEGDKQFVSVPFGSTAKRYERAAAEAELRWRGILVQSYEDAWMPVEFLGIKDGRECYRIKC